MLIAHWDSESYPPGEYEFRATAYDLAGNSATTQSRAGGAAMQLRSPLKVATTLNAGLGRARRRAPSPTGTGSPTAGAWSRGGERRSPGSG